MQDAGLGWSTVARGVGELDAPFVGVCNRAGVGTGLLQVAEARGAPTRRLDCLRVSCLPPQLCVWLCVLCEVRGAGGQRMVVSRSQYCPCMCVCM